LVLTVFFPELCCFDKISQVQNTVLKQFRGKMRKSSTMMT